ncbi:MAG: hypothetical protein LUE29_07735 [Lachnospiraceae bacterium]|nr:hypothetical protein [Lachnospiraceae bacterium]
MTAKGNIAVLTIALVCVCMDLLMGCNGSGGFASDQSADTETTLTETVESISDSVTEETVSEMDTSSEETQEDSSISMGEMEVLEDDEVDEDDLELLEEQYSDLLNEDVSFPIVP